MSKGLGQKIIVKFTLPLVGDVSNNVNAFKLTGKEYQWVDGPDDNGPLLDKEYQIDKVERYGVVPIWKINQILQLEVLSYQTGDTDTADSSSLSGSSYTTIANEVEFKKATTISKIKIKTVTSGDYTLMIKNMANTVTYQTHTLTNQPANTFIDFEIDPLFVEIGSQFRIEITRPNGKAYMVSGLYNGTSWKCIRGLFGTSWFTTFTNAMGFVEQGEIEYDVERIETTQSINLSGDYRIRWLEDKPIGTDITIEYTTGQSQGTWTETSNGDVLISDTNLWFRVTLETTDTSITPTLQDLWIEEPDAPQDMIRIVFDDYSRFPSVVGDLTVEYDATVGNLAGRGGPVEGFLETFTPTDLIPEPNPGIEETVTVVPAELLAELVEITYSNGFAEETLSAAPAELTVDLVYVGVINP